MRKINAKHQQQFVEQREKKNAQTQTHFFPKKKAIKIRQNYYQVNLTLYVHGEH